MSIKISLGDAELEAALRQISLISQDVPIAKTMTELQLVIERLTFSGMTEDQSADEASVRADIDLYFRDEVSEGMVSFVHWMARRGWLANLSGDAGMAFLNHCTTAYRSIEEVRFTTAVDLHGEHKAELVQKLRRIYPEPARILFTTSSLIGAGFTISVGNKQLADKSLRTHVINVVPRTFHLDGQKKSGDRNG